MFERLEHARSLIDMRRAWVAPLLAAAAVVGWRAFTPRDSDAHWMLIARDSSYSISLDTTRILRAFDRGYDVWYRTDHLALRFYKEKPFNRETVQALLSCYTFTFKVVSTAMSIGSARPVARQSNTRDEVAHETWHPTPAGSTEADAARATCIVADSRWRGR